MIILFLNLQRTVHTYPVHSGYRPSGGVTLGSAIIRNVKETVTKAKCNGKDVQFKYNSENKVITVEMFLFIVICDAAYQNQAISPFDICHKSTLNTFCNLIENKEISCSLT